MKIIAFLILAASCVGCVHHISDLKPNHIGVTPSCEWELQHGQKPKHKPKALMTFDWNL